MAVDKSLVSGSTTMLLLKLLSEKDMYGYEMIETLRERSQNVFELKAERSTRCCTAWRADSCSASMKRKRGKDEKILQYHQTGPEGPGGKERRVEDICTGCHKCAYGRRDCMKAEEYLSVLTDQMRCKMAREAVRDELLCHIEDQKAAFISEGMEKSEAEEAAVREMGDPVETGNEMDRIHRPKMAWGMIALITVLSITGYAIQRAMEAKVVADGGYAWLSSRNLVFLIAGLVLMMGVCFADYTRIGQRAREIMAVIDILLIGATVFSRAVNGAKTFLYLPVIGYITIEYVFLLTVPVYAAILYGYRGQGYRAIGKAVLWMIPSAFIAFRIPNIMTTAVLMLSYMIILGIAVFHGWFRVSRRRYSGRHCGGPALCSGSRYRILLVYGGGLSA